MIDLTGCVSIAYLKKAVFTGSCGKMRYLLCRAEDQEGNAAVKVSYWSVPKASYLVPEEEKTSAFFPFDSDGISQAQAWLNDLCKQDLSKQ